MPTLADNLSAYSTPAECLTVRSIPPDAAQAQAAQINQPSRHLLMPSLYSGPMCTELPSYTNAIGFKTSPNNLALPAYQN